MKKFNRVVSFVVLAAFLANSIFTDLAFSQISSDKLAAASRFGDLLGPQGQDMARIRFILAGHIAGAKDGDSVNLPRLIDTVSSYRDSSEKDKAPVEFEPLQVFGHEMQALPSNLIYVMCRVRHKFLGLHTYYAVFPRAWEGEGFPVEVYTDKEWNENKIYDFLSDNYMPDRSSYHPDIAQAIERDIAHQGFDSVLQWAHDPVNSDYVRPVSSIGMNYELTILNIMTRLTGFGVKISEADNRNILPLSARKSSIVVMTGPVRERLARNMVRLKSIDGTPLDIVPAAHLSNNYLNTLLTPQDIKMLSKGGKSADRIKDDITARWVHEVGVSAGLPIIFFDELRPVNLFDLLWKNKGDWDAVRAELDSRKIDVFDAGFKADNIYQIQDLDINIETRDAASGYGTGEAETPQAKDLLPANILSALKIASSAEIKVMPIGGIYKLVVTGAGKISVLDSDDRIIINNRDAFNGFYISPDRKYLMVRDVNLNAYVIILETLENVLPAVQDWGNEYPFSRDAKSVTITDRKLRQWRYDFITKKWTNVTPQSAALPESAASATKKVDSPAPASATGDENGPAVAPAAPESPGNSGTLPILSGMEAFTAAASSVSAGNDVVRTGFGDAGSQDRAKKESEVAVGSSEVFEISASAAQGVTKAFQEFFEASIGSSRQKKAIAEMERYPEPVYVFARDILFAVETGNNFEPLFGKNANSAYASVLRASILRGRMTKGDPRFNNLKALMESMERKIPYDSPLRERDKRYAPGKNWQAALKTIVFAKALQVESFTVTEYLAAYQEAAPVFGFEALAKRRPDDTARRDFKELIKRGYIRKVDDRRGEYTLTRKGKLEVARLTEELDPVINKDPASFIPQEIVDALEARSFTPPELRRPEEKTGLMVGVPTEIKDGAERVGLTPAGVRALVQLGATVVVQKGAGQKAGFTDEKYMDAGARMVDTAQEVWAQADIIKKVKEPLHNPKVDINELELMRSGQIVYTYLHLASPDCRDLAYAMYRKGVTGIAYETIVVIDEHGKKRTPALEPMSIIAGHLGGYFGVIYSLWSETVKVAGKDTVRLTRTGKGMMARVKSDYTHAQGFRGVAKGKKAVVMGGGISGLAAARTLLKSGVQVTVTDADPDRVEELKQILSIYGKQAEVMLVSRDINSPSADLLKRYQEADMLYGCILIPGAPAPQISPELMAKISKKELGGKPKSAVINIAIDQGGNFPESHSTYYDNPVYFDSFGNMMFSVANMPDFVGGIASVALEKTNIADTAVLVLGFEKALELSPRLKGGVNIHDGHLFVDALSNTYPDIPTANFAGREQDIKSDMTLDVSAMQDISTGMIAHMAAGLAGDPSSLDMTPTFVTAPTGKEKGDYFAIDVGGSNLRVMGVRLDGKGGYTEIGKQKVVEFQARQKTGTQEELFDFITNTVRSYLTENSIDTSEQIRMGLSWSFPVDLSGIASARHKEWTKGWDVSGVVGEDIVALMHAAFKRGAIGSAKIVALCNDTTGTLAAARYAGHSDCVGGMVLGTGWNAAFELLTRHIGKLSAFDGDRMMVNTEWENYTLPLLTKWDQELDLRPGVHGKQMLEKHVSGKYLGEIARLIVSDLVSQGKLFNGKAPTIFGKTVFEIGKEGFLAEHMSLIEFDQTPDLAGVKKVLDKLGAIDSSIEDRRTIKSVCELVSTRSAQIVAAATDALITYVDAISPRDSYSIAVDGSLYEKYPHFADRIYAALKLLRPDDYNKIRFVPAKDGSGVGAAIIAAAVSSKDPDYILAKRISARTVDALLTDLKSGDPAIRAAAGDELRRRDPKLFGEKLEAFYASLPVSGKKMLEAAKLTGRPVLALNIDNGEVSSLQIRAQMEAALDANAYLIFEVGPGALKTYDKAKPKLPEYCARIARELFEETGRSVTYAVHLDHNQIDLKKYKVDPEKALQEAIDRSIMALEAGFTSFATDTSTLTNLDAKRENYATEEEYLEARLGDVIKTGIAVLTTIYRKAKELGIEVGHEGEVGDVGKELTTFEEARYYYKSIMEGLIANGVDVKDAPWLDVMAAQLGTSHGYDFTDGDKLKPYEGGGITVEEYSTAVKKGVVLVRAKEIAKRFKEELGLDVGVALHGFSGTPLEVAPSFVGTGIAKVNINTDWQAITWKVLQAYFPELYKRCYDLSHAAAETALKKLKEQLANAKDDTEAAKFRKSVEKLQALVDMPFERSRNKIIFGKDGAPGLRTLFRGEVGWALEEEIVETLKRTDVRMIIPAEQNKEDMLDILLTCQRCGPNDKNGLTALEAVHKLTKDRTLALMTALGLDDSADRTPPTDKARELRLQDWQVEELTPSGRDRFTTALQVPKDHHPDLKEVLPGQSGSYRYGGNTYSVGRLLVPSNPDRLFTPEELFETGTYMAEGQKRVMVESDDMMTYMSADILTSIMNAAEFQYTFGLATGGTTEALRKLMGLGDMIKSLYGRTLDTDKIRKVCTLDNYYFNYYLKRNGFTPEEADKIIEISSYESEQLYMMIKNLMGGDVKPGFFIAPPGVTDKLWFESAEEFKMLLAKYFCVERFVQLWQLHGIGTNSHDAFNEVYARLKRELSEITLELYRDGMVKRALMRDGTDLAKLGLSRLPAFKKIPGQFAEMGMMRDDHPSLISFIIQVQNNGHFLTLIRQIMDKRYGPGKVPFKQFHPFFLKYMGDNSLYDVDELISVILLSTPEQLLKYTNNPKYHFKDMEDFTAQLQFLLDMYASVPEESTSQGVGATIHRGSLRLPDGNYPVQLIMACAAHKQLAVMRALQWPSQWSTSSTLLHLAKNALLVATEESLGMVLDSETMNTFIKVRPDKADRIAGLDRRIEEAWGKTPPGVRVNGILRGESNEETAKVDPAATDGSKVQKPEQKADTGIGVDLETARFNTRRAREVISVIAKSGSLQRLVKQNIGFRLPDYTAVCPAELKNSAGEDLDLLVDRGVLVRNEMRTYMPSPAWVENMNKLTRLSSRTGTLAEDDAMIDGRYQLNGMSDLASQVGLEMPTLPGERYRFLVPESFFAAGELDNDKNKFGDRFELDGVKGETGSDLVRSIIRRSRGNERRSIAVIPSNLSLSDKNINDLQDLGIGFIRIDAEAISELRFASVLERAQFRMDTYAIMWLARYIRDATPESGAYELLKFYLKTHFAFASAAEMDSYIDALVKGELRKLVKVYLKFRPSIPKDAEADYHRVAASLIFA